MTRSEDPYNVLVVVLDSPYTQRLAPHLIGQIVNANPGENHSVIVWDRLTESHLYLWEMPERVEAGTAEFRYLTPLEQLAMEA